MRNRAKCKLCNEIIESFHRYDYITCKCGEISISGGLQSLECSAKNFSNFLRIDDVGNEMVVRVVDKDEQNDEVPKPTKKEMIESLENMIRSLENLPDHAMESPVNHYDLYTYLILIVQIFKE